ncbi:hypothetical protein ML603_08220 [Streptococcus dysgalactiae subsp. equisimilis]|uniref:hypothetical protein n=1 Tax=Streptococcus dysgalactiae TaxID=1334 RepID=UPI001F142D92|nr:hypothetical protein [Streptococcus dysgalactiae]MCL6222224.1 hypothetical protein [Streptococcus dysgalactiae subsp. equisimilis]UMY67440.1 hypothetical protein ML603_05995 [Streptococcus dysgalactiae subsp. equisimilis]UMY67856.1 hypothetical protein ML603_08220 [Streptococcus dysgalactiae subsp. equisimilis]
MAETILNNYDSYILVDGSNMLSAVYGDELTTGQYYIANAGDRWRWGGDLEVDVYYATANNKAIVYRSKMSTYQTDNPNASKSNKIKWQSITINGLKIASVTSNNVVIWSNGQTTNDTSMTTKTYYDVRIYPNSYDIYMEISDNFAKDNLKKLKEIYINDNKIEFTSVSNSAPFLLVKALSTVRLNSGTVRLVFDIAPVQTIPQETAMQYGTLLFDSQPTDEYTRLDLYTTYIFVRDGTPPLTKLASELGYENVPLGNGFIMVYKTSTALYVKSYGTPFNVKIYGKN